MSSLQESQTQLEHTQEALTEQHDKVLHLSQKVVALRRLQRRANLHQEHSASPVSQLNHEALEETDRCEEEAEADGRTMEDTLNKTQVFSYQSPGLEILQCKYRVAVTEVVELKAEVQALHDRLAHYMAVPAAETAIPSSHVQQLETQVSSMEKNCQQSREKVTTSQ